MDNLQFYPTPLSLALQMIAAFDTPPWEGRVLEPSAGDGALARALVQACLSDLEKVPGLEEAVAEFRGACQDPDARPSYIRTRQRQFVSIHIDFIEMDMRRHAALREIDGVDGNVIGLDFLEFSGTLAPFSHIIINPPFAGGAQHLLKAWEGLFDGEIVCLLNAETLRNAYSKERQHLVRLIEEHGDVQFLQDAFQGEGVERQAQVEVAIVHLVKRASVETDFLSGLFDGLAADSMYGNDKNDAHLRGLGLSGFGQELALPTDVIDRTLQAFHAAVRCMRENVVARVRADYTAKLVGMTLAQRDNNAAQDHATPTVNDIRKEISAGYDALKDRAWAEVLRSTQTTKRLSSKAQQRLEHDFEQIKKLDFSKSNILGFLLGLIESQAEMNLQMALDVFDEITRYHTENTVHFEGWKSNDAHRTLGRRVKLRRFVLPGFGKESYSNGLSFDRLRRLADFDKVFATLDGRHPETVFGIADAFEIKDTARRQDLLSSKRLTTDYFDLRWFPKKGTIHFFPRSRELVDRLNRLVGRHRQWLPPHEDLVNEDFWLAYNKAEEFEAEVAERLKPQQRHAWESVLDRACRGDEPTAEAAVLQAVQAVNEAHGLHPQAQIETQEMKLPLLAMAA